MRTRLISLAVLSALTAGGAQASVIGVSGADGSEVLLNLVNTGDSSSITLDLGEQIAGLGLGDAFTLPASVLGFISGAGGLAGIQFSVIAGQATNGTSAATYLHSTDNAAVGNIANGVRGTWFSSLNTFIAGAQGLNSSNPADTDTSVDAAYGPFPSGTAGRNFVTAGVDDWGTAATCVANDNVCNLVNGTEAANLFLINFGTSPTGIATRTSLDLLAALNLANSQLEITAIPLPAAVWLFASGLGVAGLRARRRQLAA